jgi:hypothetical protein
MLDKPNARLYISINKIKQEENIMKLHRKNHKLTPIKKRALKKMRKNQNARDAAAWNFLK